MRIKAVETWLTRVPFDIGAPPAAFGGMGWQALETLWVRVVTDTGIEGWGEGFGHACCPATRAAIDTQIGPAVLGQDARDIRGLARRLAEQFHLFGRNGPHLYGLSAIDIALWDIAGKAAGLPLWRLLGGAPVAMRPAYASLLRYGDPNLLARACERAAAAGYGLVKLHEVTEPAVAAAREALGPDRKMMVDVNCPWAVDEAIEMAETFADHDLHWLEEPVWPPEDREGLARVRAEGGVRIAAGENAGGLLDFRSLFEAEALDFAQPSVAKIGGVTVMADVAALARAFSVPLVPHCAYFGPGWLASLHVIAAFAPEAPVERLFMDLEASPYGDLVLATRGAVAIPQGPGLGRDPDSDVLRRYLVGTPLTASA
ncbi:MAG: mandelate racemase/muconate lactonizing enzyme family protein [Acetobacteraceae bacterium]|nr:mandelate racemase/muconate lactonizing enzyme family protein [Acetobacteraceae bacterium]